MLAFSIFRIWPHRRSGSATTHNRSRDLKTKPAEGPPHEEPANHRAQISRLDLNRITHSAAASTTKQKQSSPPPLRPETPNNQGRTDEVWKEM